MQLDGLKSALSPVVCGDIAPSINTKYKKKKYTTVKYVIGPML